MMMMMHIVQTHGIMDPAATPPLRSWSSGLCDTEGCLEIWCCSMCNGSRQMMALSGWEDTFDTGWCMFFVAMGIRIRRFGDYAIVYYVPPHLLIAALTRPLLLRLNNIDEGICSTCCILLCCAPCSVAQTHRELGASGVWPGSSCGGSKPSYYNTVGTSAPPMLKMML